MAAIEDYYSAEYWARNGWVAPWLKEVDPSYWREMTICIGEHWPIRKNISWQEFFLTPEGRARLRDQLCTRISQASDHFVPWLEQAVPLAGTRVLEIGCGSGSSTAGLSHAGARVTGLDIKTQSLAIATRRLSLLGFDAELIAMPEDWLGCEAPPEPPPGPYDLIVCYAMLEHLTVEERLNLLTMCRAAMARDGAMLAVFETPNRLAPFDWHTTKLAFSEILPDALAYRYIMENPSMQKHPARHHAWPDPEARKALYRRGRGVSWHEFELVFGLEAMDVLLDGYSPKSHQRNYKPSHPLEKALAQIFESMTPPVPRGFCRPSLELLLRLKT